MDKTEHRSFHAPDETREFPNGRAEILKVGGGEVGRLVFTFLSGSGANVLVLNDAGRPSRTARRA